MCMRCPRVVKLLTLNKSLERINSDVILDCVGSTRDFEKTYNDKGKASDTDKKLTENIENIASEDESYPLEKEVHNNWEDLETQQAPASLSLLRFRRGCHFMATLCFLAIGVRLVLYAIDSEYQF